MTAPSPSPTTVTVYGADRCEDTQRSRRLLRRLGVSHQYRNVDEDLDALEQATTLGRGVRRTPVVEIEGGSRALGLRRIPSPPGALEHVVMDGERLDHLAARFYGDATRYWVLLDGNPEELNPLELLVPGRRIAVPADTGSES